MSDSKVSITFNFTQKTKDLVCSLCDRGPCESELPLTEITEKEVLLAIVVVDGIHEAKAKTENSPTTEHEVPDSLVGEPEGIMFKVADFGMN